MAQQGRSEMSCEVEIKAALGIAMASPGAARKLGRMFLLFC